MNKNVIVIIIIALIFFSIGFATSFFTQKEAKIVSAPPENNSQKTYQQGWDDAVKRLGDFTIEYIEEDEGPVKVLSGEILDINNDFFELKINKFDPFADKELDTREVRLANAEILKVVKKEEAEYLAELDDYNTRFVQGLVDDQEEQPPAQFKKIEVNAGELEVGLIVHVESSSDIRNSKQFGVDRIVIQNQY